MTTAPPVHGVLSAFDAAPAWLNSEPLTAQALAEFLAPYRDAAHTAGTLSPA